MQVRVTPTGFIDKDTEESYINKGNYTDANNIRHRNLDGQNFGGVMPFKGNVNAISVVNGSPATTLTYSSSTESYKISFDVTDIANGSVSSHVADLTLEADTITPPTSYNYASTTPAAAYTAITSALTSLASVYNALPGAISFITFTYGSLTTDGLKGSFTLTSNLNEFDLIVNNTEGLYFQIEKRTEYISTGGNLSIVGSAQVDDDLFVLCAGSVTNADGTSEVSQIGVIYPSGSDYDFTTLIQSKELKLHQERKCEMQVEKVGAQINLYWTDNLNPIRYIELEKSNKRLQDGLFLSNGGKYELQNINQESKLILPSVSSYIEDINVIHGAGSITSGNKRYTGRFVTEDFSYSDFLYPTNPINIYDADPSIPFQVSGNNPTVLTSKAVEMVLKNIPQGIYTYFDLVAIEYKGDVFEPVRVQRFTIDENATELKLRHTNRGQTNEVLSIPELLAITSKYTTAKSLKLFDNRMTLSNLTEQIDLNLEAWASTFTHSLETAQIPNVGTITEDSLLSQKLDYQLGEYLDPLNTLQFTSYMMNDTYRFGVQVQWKNTGKWSSAYWVDDIRFDTLSSNVNAFDNRRSANNVDTNLTNATTENVNIYYVQFGNINLDYLVDGVPIRDLISSIRFVRAERISEVLATGYFLPGVGYPNPADEVDPYFPSSVFSSGISSVVRRTYPLGSLSQSVDNSEYVFFYSPDLFYSGDEYDYDQNKDSLKILGVPNIKEIVSTETDPATPSGLSTAPSSYTDFNGYFYTNPEEYFEISSTSASISITEHKTLNPKEKATFTKTVTNGSSKSSNQKCEFFKFGAKLYNNGYFSNPGANSENIGVYYGQLFRDLGANLKYPINKRETVYQSVGHYRLLKEGENGIISENVFGGDVFNQKTHYLLRMPDFRYPNWGDGAAFGMYTQNVLNTQMFEVLEHDGTRTGDGYIFPQSINTEATGEYFVLSSTSIKTFDADTIVSGLAHFMEQWPEVYGQNEYSTSYNYVDNSITETGFDNTSKYDGSKPATIAYSAKKAIGSTKNSYRYFQPTSFSDLDAINGEISHHEVINDNFYTFQERSVQRQYFRDASLISADTGSSVVVGSGSILSSPGVELTSIGTSKKESVIVGQTMNGKDAAYWYNDRLQKIVRLAGDGVTVISDRGLSSYLKTNGKYISNEIYPLSGKGVHAVWNDKYSEAIFTFKGDDFTDFTIAYDEVKDGFVSFHSYKPNIYLPYNNTFFTIDPSATNTVYLHDEGSDSVFYGVTEPSNITFIMNYEPNIIKYYEAMQVNSDKVPFETDFFTELHESYLDETEFIDREGLWYSSIKNDKLSAPLSTNAEDTTRLFGKWLKVKFSMEAASGTQKLVNAIIKFRPSPRLYNT